MSQLFLWISIYRFSVLRKKSVFEFRISWFWQDHTVTKIYLFFHYTKYSIFTETPNANKFLASVPAKKPNGTWRRVALCAKKGAQRKIKFLGFRTKKFKQEPLKDHFVVHLSVNPLFSGTRGGKSVISLSSDIKQPSKSAQSKVCGHKRHPFSAYF